MIYIINTMHQKIILYGLMKFLNKLDKIDFLKNYWEQKPVVIKNALQGINAESLIDLNELIEMATDDYFESRLVSFNDPQWSVQDGPIERKDITDQTKNWTLVNHNLELYLENIYKLTKQMSFLPRWLFDDAMSTYSTDGSSVGAHIDNYNVFIMQLQGKRKWEIQHNPNPEFQEGLAVKILKEFTADESFTLEPGDLIYIPPHVAHHGISIGQSLSISLGFKSLEDKKLIDQLSLELINEFDSEAFYKTKYSGIEKDQLVIDELNLKDIEERLLKLISDKKFLAKSILKFGSRTKRVTQFNDDLEYDEFIKHFKELPLYKDEFIRFAALKNKENYQLAINEFVFDLDADQYSKLSNISEYTAQDMIEYSTYENYSDILYQWFQLGFVFFAPE